jgi:transcriptional regulator with XRE-family HTH domain
VEKLGKYLRENREAKGIALEEIEQVSNISLTYLRALEEGQMHVLPASTFTVGFLRQYARCIGLDPEDVVLRYRTASQGGSGRFREPSMEKVGRGRKRSIWGLGVSLLFLGLLWAALYPGREMTEERVRTIRMPRTSLEEIKKEQLKRELGILEEAPPDEASGREAATATEGPEGGGGKDQQVLPKTGAVEVILQALEETKVQIILDDALPYEEVLEPGDRHSCRAKKRVKLQIGNGSGVRIFYNGKVYENLGKKGDVVHISFPPWGAG